MDSVGRRMKRVFCSGHINFDGVRTSCGREQEIDSNPDVRARSRHVYYEVNLAHCRNSKALTAESVLTRVYSVFNEIAEEQKVGDVLILSRSCNVGKKREATAREANRQAFLVALRLELETNLT